MALSCKLQKCSSNLLFPWSQSCRCFCTSLGFFLDESKRKFLNLCLLSSLINFAGPLCVHYVPLVLLKTDKMIRYLMIYSYVYIWCALKNRDCVTPAQSTETHICTLNSSMKFASPSLLCICLPFQCPSSVFLLPFVL